MRANCILPDESLPDFRDRITRVRAARSLAQSGRGRRSIRKAGVLAAAVAVPALALPGGLQGLTMPSANAAAATIAPMGFETPGESFPGSAFYYLEDAPQTGEAKPGLSAAPQAAAPLGQGTASAFIAGPAARSLRVAGSLTDQARAQQCMTQAIYYEAASESDAGQRAVAQVVLNRLAHPSYPSTVCGVVFQGSQRSTGCQFTFTCDGSLGRQPSAFMWGRASRIARQALAGAVYAPVGLATHYHTLAVHPYWADSLTEVAVIGAHQFYRWRGAAGTSRAFTGRYLGGEPAPGRTAALMAQADSGAAPDPASPLVMENPLPDSSAFQPGHDLAAKPAQPTAMAEDRRAPGAIPAAAQGSRLPGGGAIRAEYARSGSWREEPKPD
ncbi:cell wall hydrolase [Aurantiacibacter suaedae]|uniref:cell wall hydrolase n=1 Tax=Aurantiacibacter suaedae TaxID=2545755 RepID=UPI001F4F14B4|nr:cell wall hydrolase [Aurantiacibacter suaedae]